MSGMQRILVVINSADEVGFVLEKAAVLAGAENAHVQIVRSIYDEMVNFRELSPETAQTLKLQHMKSEEKFLVGLVHEYRSKFRDIETFTLWNKRCSEAALEAARKFSADLIIKAVDTTPAGFASNPDDWHLLRQAHQPVMLLRQHPWRKPAFREQPVVLAALDLLADKHDDMSRKVLVAASQLAADLDSVLHVVCAYPGLATWATADASLGIDLSRVEAGVADTAKTKLAAFSAGGFDNKRLHLGAGAATEVVRAAVARHHPQVLALGTAARTGVGGFVLGNTAEKLISRTPADLYVIPTAG